MESHLPGRAMGDKKEATGKMKTDHELELGLPAASKIGHLLNRVPYLDTAEGKQDCLRHKENIRLFL
jgi:hypothetical protein